MRFKKNKKLIILFLIIVSCFCVSETAFARAGGGGGSSGGGGGGSSSGTHRTGSDGGRSNPVSFLIQGMMFFLIGSGGTIVFVYHSHKAKRKSIHLMESYAELGINWDYHEIQRRVEESYFVIQESWRRYDPSYAAEYLSEELAQRWNTKLQWMKIRNEEIVQKNVRLLSAVPVGVYDEAGEDKDKIWYLIHGKMIGYYRNRETKELIRGNPRNEAFYEYWLFICHEGKWVLHEIRQKDEMNIREFSN